MEQDEVSQILIETELNQILHDIGATIDPFSIGHDDSHLLEKLHESGGRVPGCCDEDLGVRVEQIGILIINMSPGDEGVEVVSLQLLLKVILFAEEFGGEPGVVLLGIKDLAFLF